LNGPDSNNIDLSKFPDNPAQGRMRIAVEWMDDVNESLLDAGCSYGYGTIHYSRKAKKTTGIELDSLSIEVAKKKYPAIEFHNGSLEELPFGDESFDTIIMADVFEHVHNRQKVLDELFRVMRAGAYVIITTPHTGLFAFLDPYNHGYYLKKYFGPIYTALFKAVRFFKGKKPEGNSNPSHNEKHHHFSYGDFIEMLDNSEFKGYYRIERKKRSGLFAEVFHLNLEYFLKVIIRNEKVIRAIIRPFSIISDIDYSISYGILAYNIALKIRKI
jgi:ubiquinone/menaquinone biosynthesis C-methylase UbiE